MVVGVVWCGVVYGVVWCGVWCGVVWCMVWCGVWCGVVWCMVWCVVCGVLGVVVWCSSVWYGLLWFVGLSTFLNIFRHVCRVQKENQEVRDQKEVTEKRCIKTAVCRTQVQHYYASLITDLPIWELQQ